MGKFFLVIVCAYTLMITFTDQGLSKQKPVFGSTKADICMKRYFNCADGCNKYTDITQYGECVKKCENTNKRCLKKAKARESDSNINTDVNGDGLTKK